MVGMIRVVSKTPESTQQPKDQDKLPTTATQKKDDVVQFFELSSAGYYDQGQEKSPGRFATAMLSQFITFRLTQVSREECMDECLGMPLPKCRGIYYMRRSHRCRGLSNIGGELVHTSIDAESWTRRSPNSG
jgi:hypothetical protein